jgi:Flp pilus assembly protein TadG
VLIGASCGQPIEPQPGDRRRQLTSVTLGGFRMRNVDRSRRDRAFGQSLVEFALVLPVMLALVGAAIDVARLYSTWINLEAATRDAAQAIASYSSGDDTTNNLYNYYDPTSIAYLDPVTSGKCMSDAAAATVLRAETGRTFNAAVPVRSGTYCNTAPTLSTCTAPTVVTSWRYDDGTGPKPGTLPGSADPAGSVSYPVATVQVRSCVPFRMLFSYPFITHDGTWILTSDRTVKTLLGR